MEAVSLFSGGLDSILSVKLMQRQGIEIKGLHIISPFTVIDMEKGVKNLKDRAEKIGISLEIGSTGMDFIDIIKNPRYGYGKNLNPCVDCRIYMYNKAKNFMEKIGASFIITGEVLGQRPMTQTRDTMNLIEERAGMEGLVVRPLSAKLLEPTIPEEKGWIEREKLLDIQGRGRKRQIELADKFGIKDYPSPAGGCRLTDPNYSRRVQDSIESGENSQRDLILLRYGRHFRLENGNKIIVGRDEEENETILELARSSDVLLKITDCGSPITLIKGGGNEEDIEKAASICARYASCDSMKMNAEVWEKEGDRWEVEVKPADTQWVNSLIIK